MIRYNGEKETLLSRPHGMPMLLTQAVQYDICNILFYVVYDIYDKAHLWKWEKVMGVQLRGRITKYWNG